MIRYRVLTLGVPYAISLVSFAAAIGHQTSGVGRVLMAATAFCAPFMAWVPARYATLVLLSAAWLGRGLAAATVGIANYDATTNLTVALLWPGAWWLAVAAMRHYHAVRVEEKALGI